MRKEHIPPQQRFTRDLHQEKQSLKRSWTNRFFLVQTKFDNLYANFRSRSNKEKMALKLLAFYLSQDTISEKDMSEVEQARFYEVFSQGFFGGFDC